MNIATVGLTRRICGVVVKFCSEVCSEEFVANPKILNLLPVMFSVANDNGKIIVTPPSGHKMLQRVTDHFDEDEGSLAATHTTRICVGDGSVEFPKDKVYIIYEMSTVLRQTFAAFFVSDDFSIIPLSVSSQGCDVEVVMWFAKSIQQQLFSVLEAVVSETTCSSFKAWCTAAVQGEPSYFVSLPYFKQY